MGTQSLTRKPRSTLDDHVSNCSLQYSDFKLVLSTNLSINFRVIFPLYRGGQFYWWRNSAKTTDQQQVTDILYHIMLHGVHLVISCSK